MKLFVSTVTALGLTLIALPALAANQGDPVRGEEKAQACLACHSAEAVEGNPEWPRLHGQYANYIVESLQAYKSGARENAIMSGQVSNLSTQDMRDLAAWFSSQDGELYTPRNR